MDTLFICPGCSTQNFISKERFAVIDQAPFHCWRCESEIAKDVILKKIMEFAQEKKMEKGTMGEKIVVLITVGAEEEAIKIANALLEERLIACANIIPRVRSVYRWKGKLCDDQEMLMVLKTVRAHFTGIKERVRQLHSYEVPEIIALAIEEGNEAYLQWVEEETTTHQS